MPTTITFNFAGSDTAERLVVQEEPEEVAAVLSSQAFPPLTRSTKQGERTVYVAAANVAHFEEQRSKTLRMSA